MNESAVTALMHLKMIVKAAEGDYSPRAGELAKREAAVAAFVFTGQCLADDSIRSLIAKITDVVNSHFSMVNESAASSADAA